jgi:hypothetical protein
LIGFQPVPHYTIKKDDYCYYFEAQISLLEKYIQEWKSEAVDSGSKYDVILLASFLYADSAFDYSGFLARTGLVDVRTVNKNISTITGSLCSIQGELHHSTSDFVFISQALVSAVTNYSILTDFGLSCSENVTRFSDNNNPKDMTQWPTFVSMNTYYLPVEAKTNSPPVEHTSVLLYLAYILIVLLVFGILVGIVLHFRNKAGESAAANKEAKEPLRQTQESMNIQPLPDNYDSEQM